MKNKPIIDQGSYKFYPPNEGYSVSANDGQYFLGAYHKYKRCRLHIFSPNLSEEISAMEFDLLPVDNEQQAIQAFYKIYKLYELKNFT